MVHTFFLQIMAQATVLGILFFPPVPALAAAGEGAPAGQPTQALTAFPGSAPSAAAIPGTTPNAYNRIILPEALIITKKPGYLFMVWDVFPLRDRLAPGDKAREISALRYAAYLALAHGFLKYPGIPEARVNLIAFKAHDEYGGPRWDLAEKWYLTTFRADRFKAQGITQPESLWTLDEKKLRQLPEPPSGQAQ